MSLSVPIFIEESAGIDRPKEPVSFGIPFPKGALVRIERLVLRELTGEQLRLQTQPLATWPDGSLKWVLVDFQASVCAGDTKEYELRVEEEKTVKDVGPEVSIEESGEEILVDTGAARFHICKKRFRPFSRVVVGGKDLLGQTGGSTSVTCDKGHEHEALVRSVTRETDGPLRSTLKLEGEFVCDGREPLMRFVSRISFLAGASTAKIEYSVWNPRAAKHPGGLWDLGDPGSVLFKDLSLLLFTATASGRSAHWATRRDMEIQNTKGDLEIYQDSSGGDNWHSANHVNRFGDVKTSFCGYVVSQGDRTLEKGRRPEPHLALSDDSVTIWATITHFWQNFPKALEARGGEISIRLFPRQFHDLYELQGGERKTHVVHLDFKAGRPGGRQSWVHSPLIPHSTPHWYATTGAIPNLVPEENDPNRVLLELMRNAIEGSNTFLERREKIDEYGWRNFGELYADHEAVYHSGMDPLISHYNNQYDAVYGLLMRYLSTGDKRWYDIADALSLHVSDIDIYHTDRDRPQYNRGLFWHTDHYLPVETCTHRCFSKKNMRGRQAGSYGGGPSLSHSYSSGLLLHYHLTGYQLSREAVSELVSYQLNNIAMANTVSCKCLKLTKRLLGRIGKRTSAGLVKLEKVFSLDGPGRSSGNALSVLLDGYDAEGSTECLRAAEHLILTCVSPEDDVSAMDLLDVENRWMYTIFLQSLAKYLRGKEDAGERDAMWAYAAESLAKYVRWMMKEESTYLSKPERLEYPTETWAAQDIKKCAALVLGIPYAMRDEKAAIADKAFELLRAATSQLTSYATCTSTRPLVLIMQNLHHVSHFISSRGRDEFVDSEKASRSSSRSSRTLRLVPDAPLLRDLMMFSLRRELEFIRWTLRSV